MTPATLVRPCTSCPSLLISAPASGQGKTTVTAALARHFLDRGLRVRVFKTGPDFIDPMILERASGHPVYQLDLWMGGEAHCRQLLYEAASASDLILIEGVMGLFDGDPCSADLAARFGVPVLTVIDGSAMAQTFGALAHGLATYRSDAPFAGVFANRVAGEHHYAMLAESLPPGMTCYGWLPRDAKFELPERHLGLLQAMEIADLDTRIVYAANRLGPVPLPRAVTFTASPEVIISPQLRGVRIAVARDLAFSFLYPANLDVLRALGADIIFFSPLADSALPTCDSLYLPGGYPELHLRALQDNRSIADAIRAHHAAGKPIVAECGGLLYLLDSLTSAQGERASLVGLLPGHARMREHLVALALQAVELPEGALRGHTFHHSQLEIGLTPIARATCPNSGRAGESVYRVRRLTASYIHCYFASNPATAAGLFAP